MGPARWHAVHLKGPPLTPHTGSSHAGGMSNLACFPVALLIGTCFLVALSLLHILIPFYFHDDFCFTTLLLPIKSYEDIMDELPRTPQPMVLKVRQSSCCLRELRGRCCGPTSTHGCSDILPTHLCGPLKVLNPEESCSCTVPMGTYLSATGIEPSEGLLEELLQQLHGQRAPHPSTRMCSADGKAIHRIDMCCGCGGSAALVKVNSQDVNPGSCGGANACANHGCNGSSSTSTGAVLAAALQSDKVAVGTSCAVPAGGVAVATVAAPNFIHGAACAESSLQLQQEELEQQPATHKVHTMWGCDISMPAVLTYMANQEECTLVFCCRADEFKMLIYLSNELWRWLLEKVPDDDEDHSHKKCAEVEFGVMAADSSTAAQVMDEEEDETGDIIWAVKDIWGVQLRHRGRVHTVSNQLLDDLDPAVNCQLEFLVEWEYNVERDHK